MKDNSTLNWKKVVNSIKESVILLDKNGIITNCNASFLKMINMQRAQVIGANCYTILPSGDGKSEDCPYFKSKISKKRESSNVQKDNMWFKVDIDPILDENNEISGFVQFMSDITESKQVEDTLRESEEKLRLMIDNSPIGFSATDLEGNFIELNPVTCDMIGYTQNEMMHKHFNHFTHPDDIAKNKDLYQKLVKREIPYFDLEKRYIHKNGKIINVLLRSQLIHDDNGKPLFQFAITEDITERKQVEEALLESEEKFRTLTENINVGIYRNTVGEKGKFIEANPTIVKMFGFKNKKEFLAYNVSNLYFLPEERKKFNDEMLKKGFVKDKELQLKKKDGSFFYGSISAVSIKGKDGKVQFYDGSINDITDHRQADKALQESEKKYRELFEKSKDAVLIIHNGKFVDCNQATINLLRYNNKDEFLNVHPSELSPKKQPDGKMSFTKANKMMKLAIKNGSHRFEWDHKKSDGEIFPAEVLLTTISSDDKNQIIHTVWRDITERKLAEGALKTQNLKYQTLLLNLKGMVYRCNNDKKWTMQFISAGCLSLTGYKPEELLENNKLSYNDIILPEYQGYLWDMWQEKLKSHDPVEIEYEIRTASGEIRWVWERGRGIYDEKGQLTHLEGYIADITERKLAEETLKTSEEGLRALFMAMTDIVLEIDHEGRYLDIAPTSPDLLYKPPNEILGKTLHEIFSKKEADKFLSAIHKSLDEDKIVNIDYQIEIKNKFIWFEARIAPKTKNTVLFIAHDITERRRAGQIQKAIYNITNAAGSTDNLEKLISLIHKELGIIIDTTNFYVALYDHEKDNYSLPFFTDAKDKTITFPAGKTLTNYVRKTKKSLLANKKVKKKLEKSGDIELFGVDSKVWLGVPLKVEGKITGVLAVQSYTDEFAFDESDLKMLEFVSNQVSISIERKRTEVALKESEERFKQLVENANDIIYILDANGYVTYVNPVTLKLGNYKKEDLVGIEYLDMVHPDYYHDAKRFFRKQFIKKIKNTYKEFPVKTKSGSYVWLGQNVQLLLENNKIVGFQAVARDITERKISEQALQENEKRYKYLFNQSPTSIWEEDFSEVHKYLTSLKKSGIKDFREYFEKHLDEVTKCSRLVRILDINEMTVKLFNAKSKEDLITNLGSIFTEASLSPFIDQLCSIAENQTSYNGETVNKTLDGELLNVFIRLNVVPGYEKDYSRVLISLMNITGQKKAEEGLKLGRERLKLLNQIIRHDLSNDFIVIKSAVNIFRRSSEVKMIEEIERRADKSLATIDTYRKYESFIDSNADLNKIEAAEIINDIIVEFPKIKFTIEGKCNVFADDALNSIFTNLITNSIKHGKASEIDIQISTENNMCKIKFMDNGIGIPDKIKGKIFNEGFFYGKAGHTGIGLHIVKKTIERYGGTISVEDNTPNGTVFIINLRQAL